MTDKQCRGQAAQPDLHTSATCCLKASCFAMYVEVLLKDYVENRHKPWRVACHETCPEGQRHLADGYIVCNGMDQCKGV